MKAPPIRAGGTEIAGLIPGLVTGISAGAVYLSLKVSPKASSDRIGHVVLDAAEVAHLQVFVTAVPEDGRANAAVIKLLSKRWRLPKSAFEIVRGAADRWKVVAIRTDEPGALAERMARDLSAAG